MIHTPSKRSRRLYNVFVVTASHDSTDVFGYNDIVIGHFVHNNDELVKSPKTHNFVLVTH